MKPRPVMRLAVVIALLGSLTAVPLGAPAAFGQSTPKCFGEPATIVGNDRRNFIIGTGGRDVIVGRGEHDDIRGRGGPDLICAGPGRFDDRNPRPPFSPGDFVDGGKGNDRIAGQRGPDTLEGGGGRDRIFGGLGDDNINGEGGDDILFGGPDRDQLSSGITPRGSPAFDPGDDLLFAGRGRDGLEWGPGRDLMDGGRGIDLADFIFMPRASRLRVDLRTGRGLALRTGQRFRLRDVENLRGGFARDVLLGNGDNNRIEGIGGLGVEAIWGRGGDDRLIGSDGREIMRGGEGDDLILGFFRNDILRGQGGDDRLIGHEGNDNLDGGLGLNLNDGRRGVDSCVNPNMAEGALNCEAP